MRISSAVKSLALMVAVAAPIAAQAMGGPSGPTVKFNVQGHLGEIIVNPYEIAPLTAIIRNGGYQIKDAHVTIEPKMGGQTISYNVSRRNLLTHGGVPVFGLYPDYVNKVKVDYTRIFNGKEEKFSDTYKIYGAPLFSAVVGEATEDSAFPKVEVTKVDPKYKDRLYLINNERGTTGPKGICS